MQWVGKFCTDILQSAQDLMEEVSEDFQISGSLESLMPSPPPMSHLYLKHCEGRELAEDAAIPRSDEVAESEDEDPCIANSTSMYMSGSPTQSGGLPTQSVNEMTACSSAKIRVDGHEGRR